MPNRDSREGKLNCELSVSIIVNRDRNIRRLTLSDSEWAADVRSIGLFDIVKLARQVIELA
jgi:hypothetical protein